MLVDFGVPRSNHDNSIWFGAVGQKLGVFFEGHAVRSGGHLWALFNKYVFARSKAWPDSDKVDVFLFVSGLRLLRIRIGHSSWKGRSVDEV